MVLRCQLGTYSVYVRGRTVAEGWLECLRARLMDLSIRADAVLVHKSSVAYS